MDRISLAALCSVRWGRSHHLFLGVSTPLVGLPWPPSMAPPKAWTACAYLSWSAPVIRLSSLHGKPGGEVFMHGTAGVSSGTRLILRR
jgi:hypothetical protein